jgi:hypothetical protein
MVRTSEGKHAHDSRGCQQSQIACQDKADTHDYDELGMTVRAAAGRLVLLYPPTHSPWLNPIERLGRQFRRELTHCDLFVSLEALLQATQAFFDCYNHGPQRMLSIIGAHAA